MDVKEIIINQINKLNTNKAVDTARIEGFYQGATQALQVVFGEIQKAEEEEKGLANKKEESEKKKQSK